MSVAQLRLGDFLKRERHRAEAVQATAPGKMTFEQALKTYEQRIQTMKSILTLGTLIASLSLAGAQGKLPQRSMS